MVEETNWKLGWFDEGQFGGFARGGTESDAETGGERK